EREPDLRPPAPDHRLPPRARPGTEALGRRAPDRARLPQGRTRAGLEAAGVPGARAGADGRILPAPARAAGGLRWPAAISSSPAAPDSSGSIWPTTSRARAGG